MRSALKVYVAGPYSKGIFDENIARVVDAAEQLRAAGHVPFVPHTMTFLWAVRHQHPAEYWYRFDLEWLAVCDVLLRLPGESRGTEREVAFCEERGIPVAYHIGDVFDLAARRRALDRA